MCPKDTSSLMTESCRNWIKMTDRHIMLVNSLLTGHDIYHLHILSYLFCGHWIPLAMDCFVTATEQHTPRLSNDNNCAVPVGWIEFPFLKALVVRRRCQGLCSRAGHMGMVTTAGRVV